MNKWKELKIMGMVDLYLGKHVSVFAHRDYFTIGISLQHKGAYIAFDLGHIEIKFDIVKGEDNAM